MLAHSLNQYSEESNFRKTQLFKEFARTPLGFIDVGARGGVHDLVAPVAEITSVVGFEPDSEECKRLLGIDEVSAPWAAFNLEPIGLFDKAGRFPLHHMRANTNHSLFDSNKTFVKRYAMKQFEKVDESTVETQTLDHVFENKYKQAETFGEFLKVDTQGSEFEILNGAESVLKQHTVAVVCEVSFFEIYKGQKLFSEVETYLRSLGFAFYGFDSSIHTRSRKNIDKRTCTTRERSMYADAVFLKDPLSPEAPGNTSRQNKALLLVAILLGYFDFALELNQSALSESTPEDQEKLDRFIRKVATLSPSETLEQIDRAHATAHSNPEEANILVGHFVDQRRKYCDYDDVVNVSQHIKNRL